MVPGNLPSQLEILSTGQTYYDPLFFTPFLKDPGIVSERLQKEGKKTLALKMSGVEFAESPFFWFCELLYLVQNALCMPKLQHFICQTDRKGITGAADSFLSAHMGDHVNKVSTFVM